MDLLNKHKERDFLLPSLRNVLLTKIQDDLLNDDNVLAFFYGGSVGNEMTDYFSDIDLRIVVDAARFQDFIQDKTTDLEDGGKSSILKTLIQLQATRLPTMIALSKSMFSIISLKTLSLQFG